MNRNLLIVDDEAEILEWLEELFTYSFDRDISVYTAKSAIEALSKLNSIRFDVVLTDIKMPGMDGITLFEHIKQNWPKCKTVFLTGYRNFDDLYRVMNHRDVRYILKTEGDEVIKSAVRESIDLLERELEEARQRVDENQRIEKARLWMRRDLMDQVFAGIIPEDIGSRMARMGIELDPDRNVYPYLLRIDTAKETNAVPEPALQMEYLISAIRDNQPSAIKLYIHMLDKQFAAMLVQSVNGVERDDDTVGAVAEGMLEYAQEDYRSETGRTFSAIAYPTEVTLPDLAQITPVMRMYMNHYVAGAHEMIYKPEASEQHGENMTSIQPAGQIESLFNLLEARKESDYMELLHTCLKQLLKYDDMHNPQALELYYTIAVRLLQFINENRLNEQLSYKVELYKLTDVNGHEGWSQAAQYLSDISRAIFELMDEGESNLSNRLLSRVTEYIDKHLDGDLTLTQLARVGGFNASYLSRLFKQVTGQGLSEYILQKRLTLAKELLSDTNDRIQDIASKTGYLSAHSFTRVFRTECGISPTEWRAKEQKDDF
ncbi:MAG: response regulator [Clostridia bacterium]|nr:response regulator [Clostridia bacterium]